jgi:hypothetical protein
MEVKARSKVKGACTVELLRRPFPILKWLPSYNWDFAVYDVIAGITVGLTTIPQGIAYAAVAGLPLQVKKKIYNKKSNIHRKMNFIIIRHFSIFVVRALLGFHGIIRLCNFGDFQGMFNRSHGRHVFDDVLIRQ